MPQGVPFVAVCMKLLSTNFEKNEGEKARQKQLSTCG